MPWVNGMRYRSTGPLYAASISHMGGDSVYKISLRMDRLPSPLPNIPTTTANSTISNQSTTTMDSSSTTSFDTASTLSVASTTTIVPSKPAVKDYNAAFGALQSTYGTSGHVPTPISSQKSSSSALSKLFKRPKSSEPKRSSKSSSSEASSTSASKKPAAHCSRQLPNGHILPHRFMHPLHCIWSHHLPISRAGLTPLPTCWSIVASIA
ncbi:hypothetical protein NEOLEDRAFT_422561 [Neolentinus lepideus HHB14362 ss-1]|uniref:Uncharacterized protein n=1 Tax=Neolentinus lepideus HHB14362 ss-1 TaxID=1314782 RepID=A0A165S0F9_9AGAM|nr:hypothetical protein NEOLEDRAFT_422561 [Neolentinus lepideus HHB14362 ss-1]